MILKNRMVFNHKINTGMKPIDNITLPVALKLNSESFSGLEDFFAFLGTPCWYEGIDTPTTWQKLFGWRVGPVMAWRLARITV